VIEVSDDGGGISKERVLAKARERGLVSPNAALSEADILNLIFQPGFSTAEKVSDISGRGVGMDVVRKHIQKLRGSIDIASVEGTGTTFTLKLPLTLAIIDGLVVRTGDERYIIPLASVTEMLRPAPGAVSKVENRVEVVTVRDRLLPVLRLHEKFGIEPRAKDPAEGVLVVTEADGAPFCLMVDELVGKQEVVIKSLGPVFRNVAGIAGGAILGDGHIGLILDLKGIFSGRRDL
jgi:two-component system chemotaxis sensor kinase CheA